MSKKLNPNAKPFMGGKQTNRPDAQRTPSYDNPNPKKLKRVFSPDDYIEKSVVESFASSNVTLADMVEERRNNLERSRERSMGIGNGKYTGSILYPDPPFRHYHDIKIVSETCPVYLGEDVNNIQSLDIVSDGKIGKLSTHVKLHLTSYEHIFGMVNPALVKQLFKEYSYYKILSVHVQFVPRIRKYDLTLQANEQTRPVNPDEHYYSIMRWPDTPFNPEHYFKASSLSCPVLMLDNEPHDKGQMHDKYHPTSLTWNTDYPLTGFCFLASEIPTDEVSGTVLETFDLIATTKLQFAR